MNRTKEVADQRVAAVAMGLRFFGEKSPKTTRETARSVPASAGPASAILTSKPPTSEPQNQSIAEALVAKHWASAS